MTAQKCGKLIITAIFNNEFQPMPSLWVKNQQASC